VRDRPGLSYRGEFRENSMIEIKDRESDRQAKDEDNGRRNKRVTSFDFPTCPMTTFRQTSIAARAPRMAHPSSHQWSDKWSFEALWLVLESICTATTMTRAEGLGSFGQLNPLSMALRGVFSRIRTLGVSTGGSGVGPVDWLSVELTNSNMGLSLAHGGRHLSRLV